MTDPGVSAAGDALHELCRRDAVWASRYRGWAELGRGGSATVVRTHSTASGEDIALKLFLRTADEDWQRFQSEVRNAQALVSPFIVRTYSPFRQGAVAWIEMELVEGEDLRTALKARAGRPFPLSVVREVGAAVARALAAAHEAGVVHRDVKPANVLLPRGGGPAAKLGDFGTSRLAGAERITHTGLLTGTPQFVAPEVVAGEKAGPAADVYGLAMCCHLMLSGGRFPFEIPDDAPVLQWLRAQVEATPTPVSVTNKEVPEDLVALLRRGLAKDPRDRPSALEFAEALESPPVLRRALPTRRARVRLLTGLALAAAAAFLALRGLSGKGPAAPAPPSPGVAVSTLAPAASAQPAEPSLAPPAPGGPSTPKSPAALALLPVEVAVRGDILSLSNLGTESLAELRLLWVDGQGRAHTASVPEGMGPGEELHLAFDDFSPALPPSPAAARLEVSARGRIRNMTKVFLDLR